MHFGEHLMLDGYNGDCELLNDKSVVLSVLNDLPEILGMKKLSKPEIYFAKGNNLKDPGGWSGFVVIEESHISLHTFPARGFLSADVYTCQNGLDKELIKKYFAEKFLLKEVEENFVKRGTRYPQSNLYKSKHEDK
jgi:S-adenosylmethionine decarboxylase